MHVKIAKSNFDSNIFFRPGECYLESLCIEKGKVSGIPDARFIAHSTSKLVAVMEVFETDILLVIDVNFYRTNRCRLISILFYFVGKRSILFFLIIESNYMEFFFFYVGIERIIIL